MGRHEESRQRSRATDRIEEVCPHRDERLFPRFDRFDAAVEHPLFLCDEVPEVFKVELAQLLLLEHEGDVGHRRARRKRPLWLARDEEIRASRGGSEKLTMGDRPHGVGKATRQESESSSRLRPKRLEVDFEHRCGRQCSKGRKV